MCIFFFGTPQSSKLLQLHYPSKKIGFVTLEFLIHWLDKRGHSLLLIHPFLEEYVDVLSMDSRLAAFVLSMVIFVTDLRTMLQVGDRCEVEPGAKRGTVRFVGRAEALGRGFWVGVQYDEPLGKHDGMYVHSQTHYIEK
jgi:hypothetical protein